MKLFDNKTFAGWYRRGLAYGFILGVLAVELVGTVTRLIQAHAE